MADDETTETPEARLFVGIPVIEETADRVTEYVEVLRQHTGNVRWEPRGNHHITLAFLGRWPRAGIPSVIDALTRGVADTPPFDIRLTGLDAFPDRLAPRVLWLGVSDGIDELREAHRRIEGELEAVGHDPEVRDYTPHLTLGRLTKTAGTGFDPSLFAIEAPRLLHLPVDRVSLFESPPSGPGSRPHYERVAAVDLE